MLTKVKEVRFTLALLYSAYNTVGELFKLRTAYLEDPVKALAAVSNNKWISQELRELESLFLVEANIELAKEDGLDLIHAEINTYIGYMEQHTITILDTVNNITRVNTKMITRLAEDPGLLMIDSAIRKAKSSLPFAELFEKRLESNMQVAMAKHSVVSNDYISWLYGISNELKEDNISSLINLNELIVKLNKYINTNVPVTDDSAHELAVTKLTDAANRIESSQVGISAYTQMPATRVSGLTVADSIVGYFKQVYGASVKIVRSAVLEVTTTSPAFKDSFNKELENNITNLEETLVAYSKHRYFLKNLTLSVVDVIEHEILLNIELSKYSEAQRLLTDVIKD